MGIERFSVHCKQCNSQGALSFVSIDKYHFNCYVCNISEVVGKSLEEFKHFIKVKERK